MTGKTSPKAIRAALKNISTGSGAFDQVYEDAMERINGQIKNREKLAKQVLSWITCAKRQLTTIELQHAFGVEVDKAELDEENFPQIKDIVSVCTGLVTIDKESRIVRLVHYTIQEYFERTQKRWFPDAQTYITTICVSYLSLDQFESGICPNDEEFEQRLQLNKLYNYAAHNWGHHAREASAKTNPWILGLLSNESKISGCSQAMMASKKHSLDVGYSQRVPKRMTGVHLAAYFGLSDIIMALLNRGDDPDIQDSNGRTALSYTAENGHEAVVKLLLENSGIDPDSKDSDGRTALSYAAENGHEAVVKLLLENGGIDPDSRDSDGRTALFYAAENGHKAVVKLLLENSGIDLNSNDFYSRTALSYAAENGHETVVKLLLEKGAENPNNLI